MITGINIAYGLIGISIGGVLGIFIGSICHSRACDDCSDRAFRYGPDWPDDFPPDARRCNSNPQQGVTNPAESSLGSCPADKRSAGVSPLSAGLLSQVFNGHRLTIRSLRGQTVCATDGCGAWFDSNGSDLCPRCIEKARENCK